MYGLRARCANRICTRVSKANSDTTSGLETPSGARPRRAVVPSLCPWGATCHLSSAWHCVLP
eukprot:2607128-Pyramimonas_sp.AAC.1